MGAPRGPDLTGALRPAVAVPVVGPTVRSRVVGGDRGYTTRLTGVRSGPGAHGATIDTLLQCSRCPCGAP